MRTAKKHRKLKIKIQVTIYILDMRASELLFAIAFLTILPVEAKGKLCNLKSNHLSQGHSADSGKYIITDKTSTPIYLLARNSFDTDDLGEYKGSRYTSHNYENQSSEPAVNPLLKQVSSHAIGILFLLLTWRSIGTFDVADQIISPALRLCTLASATVLLVANFLGCLLLAFKQLGNKRFLKAILALNITREFVEIAYNIFCIIFSRRGSKYYLPSEIYIGRLGTNAWFLLLCFSFSKGRWVLQRQENPQ